MKMRKKNIKWGIFAIAALLLSISCTEKFLETELSGVSTEDVYYSSVNGLSQLATGTYAALNPCAASLQTLDIMYLAFGSMASDEAEAGGEMGGNDLLDFQNWDQGNPQPTESRSESQNNWAYIYKAIGRANQVLGGIEQYRSNNGSITADSAAILNRLEGEMEFIRAFSFFKLVRIYGGVPIVDHVLGGSEYNLQRNTVAECLHFIQDRLVIAIDLLPEKSAYAASDVGRATKGAAKALLAKAYLYESSYAENYASDNRFTGCENKYAEALDYAEQVITSGQYALVGINGETFDTYWNQNGSTIYPAATPGYRYIFTIDGENSDESIFSIQAINDGLGYMLSRGTYLTIYTAVRNVNATTLGWGFDCPTEDLLNAYETGDPRKMVTIGETNDPIYTSGAWGTLDCHQSPTNMIGRKFEASPDQYWEFHRTDNSGPNNFPYIRYGDVVLMAAEAALKTGDAASALDYVNMIRKRARNGASTGVPADLSSVTFDDIVNERLLELALEGHRFFDLVRWGRQEIMVGQPLQKWLNGSPQTSPVSCQFTVGVNEFFPIPQAEIINSNNNLEQYPGYE
jgi:hypothetical protein